MKRAVVKNNRIFYVSHFLSLLLWNSEFLYVSAVVQLPIRYVSFWYAVAFTEQRCLFDKCGFLLTQYCGHKRTKIVFYRIAGGVYWSAVALTNSLVTITDPRCSLLIRDVVYLSVVSLTNLRVSITDPRKINENGQNRP